MEWRTIFYAYLANFLNGCVVISIENEHKWYKVTKTKTSCSMIQVGGFYEGSQLAQFYLAISCPKCDTLSDNCSCIFKGWKHYLSKIGWFWRYRNARTPMSKAKQFTPFLLNIFKNACDLYKIWYLNKTYICGYQNYLKSYLPSVQEW